MKNFAIVTIVSLYSVAGWGQDIYTPVLQQIEQNSTALQACRAEVEADKLENKTGLTPENPEIEFGYLWGSPSAVGRRKDVSVSQAFDFPTAYIQRGKLSNLQNNSAEHEYRTQRMDILLAAKELCVELVYYNALSNMYRRQLENATRMVDAHEKMLQAGETNRQAYNKALLNRTNMANEQQRMEVKRASLLSELAAMNGGQPIVFDASSYNAEELPSDFENWYIAAEAENPSLQYLRSQVAVADRMVGVTKADGLPKLSVGYSGEFVGDENFQGLTVGMSIPLWQNKNRVKQAKAQAVASGKMVEDAKVKYYNHLRAVYSEAVALQSTVREYAALFDGGVNEDFLLKAYNSGELSLLDYLMELEYYYSCYEKKLAAERDYALALAHLTAYKL